jgi:hypothetical protein
LVDQYRMKITFFSTTQKLLNALYYEDFYKKSAYMNP